MCFYVFALNKEKVKHMAKLAVRLTRTVVQEAVVHVDGMDMEENIKEVAYDEAAFEAIDNNCMVTEDTWRKIKPVSVDFEAVVVGEIK